MLDFQALKEAALANLNKSTEYYERLYGLHQCQQQGRKAMTFAAEKRFLAEQQGYIDRIRVLESDLFPSDQNLLRLQQGSDDSDIVQLREQLQEISRMMGAN